ncbi:uncharacterized protein [Zea mays]|uniref:uncharacterized protein n=1 Tax=Zea mays TaxID=4577 RepID=UPI0016528027|nr:uncharacterized protein LOC111591302 [Zea mays]
MAPVKLEQPSSQLWRLLPAGMQFPWPTPSRAAMAELPGSTPVPLLSPWSKPLLGQQTWPPAPGELEFFSLAALLPVHGAWEFQQQLPLLPAPSLHGEQPPCSELFPLTCSRLAPWSRAPSLQQPLHLSPFCHYGAQPRLFHSTQQIGQLLCSSIHRHQIFLGLDSARCPSALPRCAPARCVVPSRFCSHRWCTRSAAPHCCMSRCARARCSAKCLGGVLRSEPHAVVPTGCLLFLRSPVVVVVHPEASHVLRGEGKSFNARRCAELCTNRNHHRPHKHRLGLFMDREVTTVQVMWCQPQDAVGGRPKEGWT